MFKDRSIGISIFAILEVLFGLAGSMLLVKNFMSYLAVLKSADGSTGFSGALALVGIFMYLPSPMILSSGISIFIALSLGKIVNNMTLTFIYFLLMMLVGFHIYTGQFSSILTDLIIFFLLTLPIQWFLNHPKIKNLDSIKY